MIFIVYDDDLVRVTVQRLGHIFDNLIGNLCDAGISFQTFCLVFTQDTFVRVGLDMEMSFVGLVKDGTQKFSGKRFAVYDFLFLKIIDAGTVISDGVTAIIGQSQCFGLGDGTDQRAPCGNDNFMTGIQGCLDGFLIFAEIFFWLSSRVPSRSVNRIFLVAFMKVPPLYVAEDRNLP